MFHLVHRVSYPWCKHYSIEVHIMRGKILMNLKIEFRPFVKNLPSKCYFLNRCCKQSVMTLENLPLKTWNNSIREIFLFNLKSPLYGIYMHIFCERHIIIYVCMQVVNMFCCVVDKGQNQHHGTHSYMYHNNTISIICILHSSKFWHSNVLHNLFICAFGGVNSQTITKSDGIFSSTKIALHGTLQHRIYCVVGFSKGRFWKSPKIFMHHQQYLFK